MVRTAVIPVSSTHRRKIDKEDQLFDFYAPSHPKKKKVLSLLDVEYNLSFSIQFSSSTSFTASNGAVRPSSADRFTSVTLGSLSLNAAPDLDLYVSLEFAVFTVQFLLFPRYSPGLPPPKTVPSATPSKYGPSLPRPSRQLLGVSGSGSEHFASVWKFFKIITLSRINSGFGRMSFQKEICKGGMACGYAPAVGGSLMRLLDQK